MYAECDFEKNKTFEDIIGKSVKGKRQEQCQHNYLAYLVDIAEVQVLPVCLVFESMNEGWISGTETCLSQQLILLGVLTLEMEAEVDNGENHTSIASQMDTPSNVVSWGICVKEHLRTFYLLVGD